MAIQKIKQNKVSLGTDFANSNVAIVSAVSNVHSESNPIWGGHFGEGERISKAALTTLDADKRLYAITVESLRAQVRMNVKRNIIPASEGGKILEELAKIKNSIAEGSFAFSENDRNIYEAIDNHLDKNLGKTAGYLKVARSKNEQIAGDLKIWIRDAYDTLDTSLQNLQAALIDKAEENVKTTMPGYEHGQLAQPISLGHHLMAYVEMIGRDRAHIRDFRKILNKSPFGVGAIGGTAFNINRDMVSRILGFDGITANSLDTVSDRDFTADFLYFATMTSMHLSRYAEELLFWHNPNIGFISFSETFVTPNPLTPYKRDLESIEIVRGKTGNVYSSLHNVLTMLKSLPLGFTSDLFEVTKPVFDSYDALLNSINLIAAATADFIVHRKEMKEAGQYGYSTAQDLQDWLIRETGMNFGAATESTNKIIAYAVAKGKKLSLLELDELQEIEPRINDDVYSVLIPSRSIISRRSAGGSNPVQVRKAIRAARRNYL
jgi:argininosuccinate lyase